MATLFWLLGSSCGMLFELLDEVDIFLDELIYDFRDLFAVFSREPLKPPLQFSIEIDWQA